MNMRVVLTCLVAIAVAGAACAQVTADTPGYFPFWVPWTDASPTFIDMSFLNAEPAGASGRTAIRDGRFVDGKGDRLRLLGSNITFAAAFPEKEQAEAIAGYLRKLGMNVIRFHHIDTGPGPRGLWLPDGSGFDTEQRDKLDWLIYQLKQHGIYTNMNLHVSRTYPGIPSDAPRAFRYGKVLDHFYPEFIRLQKDYARDLLTRVNPYTGLSYAQDPAVLVVELNNENALTTVSPAILAEMPEPYRGELTRQWQDWLKAQYGDTAALRAHWDRTSETLGDELLRNGDFFSGATGWILEQGGGSRMRAEPIEDDRVPGGRALRVVSERLGAQTWNLQFHQIGRDLSDGAVYTARFRVWADEPCVVTVGTHLDKAPWSNCGLYQRVDATTEWREYEFMFYAVNTEPNHVRLTFNLNNRLGEFRFADVSLRRGGRLGLPEGQSLEDATVALPLANAGPNAVEALWRFVQETEWRYVTEMMDYLRDDLGVDAHLCSTQASYGGLFGVRREAALSDFVDMHAYWEHPQFPGRPWDGSDWFIRNTSMTASPTGGTLGRLAWFHHPGKPYTVSEYDHPFPNDHAVEMFPMFASFAAFQDWDGIYQFCLQSRSWSDEQRRNTDYFALATHPGKLVFVPIAALMFRMGAVAAGEDRVVVEIPTGDLPRRMAHREMSMGPLEALAATALTRPVGIRISDGTGAPDVEAVPRVEPPFLASTGQIHWHPTDEAGALYTVNAPAVRAAVGYLGGRQIRLGDVTIHVEKAENDWAAVAVGALDGKPIAESGRILVVVAGRVENSNMGWNDERTTVSNRRGDAPMVAEAVEARIELPGAVTVHALDGAGAPTHAVEGLSEQPGAFRTSREHRTLWYGVTR